MIESDFQSARFDVWHAVDLIVLKQPRGQRRCSKAPVTGWNAEEKNFLPGGKNARSQNFREEFSKPRTAGEHEAASGNSFACSCFHFSSQCGIRNNLRQSVFRTEAQ